MSNVSRRLFFWVGSLLLAVATAPTQVRAQVTLFQNVQIFDGIHDELSPPSFVLVRGNRIERISSSPIPTDRRGDTVLIDGSGCTLMPGLIDSHTHLLFSLVPQQAALMSDAGFLHVVSTRTASDTLMRGFTSVRDLGGPVFGLKKGIDSGLVVGPRIWPSGAFISQSGGHGDFRMPNEFPAPASSLSISERMGGSAIADDAATVRKRARELLGLGASQIKLMAGGGVSSPYDPIDVTQYTVEELRAAVEAAENWGTYVTVHAYTPKAVRQAIEAGVRCIDHGQLLDDDTAKLMADKKVWWSLQPFLDDRPSPFAEGSPNRLKQLEMYQGTDLAYKLAKKYKIQTAWGTDNLFSAEGAKLQGAQLAKMTRWYTPVEVLRMATSGNAALLALSGKRAPYEGKLGVIESDALADLILVRGNPLEEIELIANPSKAFVVIMKDGKIFKNTVTSNAVTSNAVTPTP